MKRWCHSQVVVPLLLATVGCHGAEHAEARAAHRALADKSCEQPDTIAEIASGPIHCEPWDIGTGVQGYVWRAPDEHGVVLLQHGMSEYAQRYVRQYSRLIPQLLEAGFTVYAIDLWGHGHSPGEPGVTDLREAVDDHLAARRLLQSSSRPLFLVGHSLGGFVTASSVLRDPSGVSGVVLTSPVDPQMPSNVVERVVARGLASIVPDFGVPSVGQGKVSRDTDANHKVARDPLIQRQTVPWIMASSVLDLARENVGLTSSWTVPVMILHGTADKVTSPHGSQRFFDALVARDKSLQLVDGGFHELLNDFDKDRTIAAILDWITHRTPR